MTRLMRFWLAVGASVFAVSGFCAQELPDPLLAGWQGEPVCEVLEQDTRLRVLRCSFAPGVGHERHFHAPHWGFALEGGLMRITDSSGVREARLNTGSSFSSEGTAWHEVLNIGDSTVTYLIVEPLPVQ
jgi:quercetin dioxygenase-like cupin family protein